MDLQKEKDILAVATGKRQSVENWKDEFAKKLFNKNKPSIVIPVQSKMNAAIRLAVAQTMYPTYFKEKKIL